MGNNVGKVAASAVLAVLTLAGCSDDGGSKSGGGDPTEASMPLAPQVEWADDMCTAVVQTSVTLEPPQIDRKNVAATLDVLVDLFGTMAGQLEEQHAQLTEVGPPPDGGERAYRTAMRHLDEAQGIADRVGRSLSRSADAPPANLDDALSATGGLKVDGADYPGFVLDLVGQDQDLLPPIAQAPTCASLTTS
jgi:hypothetical protein